MRNKYYNQTLGEKTKSKGPSKKMTGICPILGMSSQLPCFGAMVVTSKSLLHPVKACDARTNVESLRGLSKQMVHDHQPVPSESAVLSRLLWNIRKCHRTVNISAKI